MGESPVAEVSPRPGVTKARPDSPKPGPSGFPTVPSWEYSAGASGIFSISFSPTSQEVAVAQTNGFVQIISSRTGRLSYSVPFIDPNTVVTVAKFHPQNDQRLILTCGTSGYIGLCQYFRGQYVWRAQELDTNILAGDFSMDGSHFASAGKDAIVRVYDTASHHLVQTFSKENGGHSSRVHSVVFARGNNDLLLTGGWDMRVLVWDIRQGRAVLGLGGPNICGDSVDICGNNILTGSWRIDHPLELWDVRNADAPISSGVWGGSDDCQVYTAKFCHAEKWIVAGGSESHSAKTFTCPEITAADRLGYFDRAVVSVAVSGDGRTVIAASQDGRCCGFAKSFG
jgi:WD40 repeat protein